jgi:hypothetical protein
MSEINTVGELAQAISNLPDDMPLIVRADGERDRVDLYVDDGVLFLEGFT